MAPSRVDVHAHYLPPKYREACMKHGHAKPDGMPALPEWSEEAHLDVMSRVGITKSILSISSPGTHLVAGNDALAAEMARYCNTYAAALKKRRPDKFGYFASLPLPNVQLALDEIERASEEGADGFTMLTNGHGHYLGDAIFDLVFDELNKQKATIFIHPTTPCIACESGPIKAAPLAYTYPNPIMEFFFDTARIMTNLFLSGTVARCPDIKFIIPHAGGAFPPLLSRFTGFSQLVPGPWTGMSEEQARKVFERQFWFDLAGFPFPGQIVGLRASTGVGVDRLLYGSDFPFTKAPGVEMLAAQMDQGIQAAYSVDEIEQISSGNAVELLQKYFK